MSKEPSIIKQTLENGQRVVTKGNLTLTQTIISGIRFNDCTINHGDGYEIVSQHDKRFSTLFIALSEY